MNGTIYCTINGENTKEVHIIVGELTEDQQKGLDRKVSQAMNKGYDVEWPDGTCQWIAKAPLFDVPKYQAATSGGGFTWDATGERIKCEYILKTLELDHTISEKILRTGFVNFDKAWD